MLSASKCPILIHSNLLALHMNWKKYGALCFKYPNLHAKSEGQNESLSSLEPCALAQR